MLSTAVSIAWEGAQHAFGLHPGFEGRVALGVEGFGLGHAAGHPEDDDGVGGGRNFSAGLRQQRLAPCERGQRGPGGSAQKSAARKLANNLPFVLIHPIIHIIPILQ